LSLPSTRGPLRDLGSFPTRRASDLMDELRPHEAEALAGRLLAFAEKGVPFARMAVLARNRRQLAAAQATLGANGVPTVFSRRGLFTRQEVVDVRNALEVGAGPSRESLAAFLR